MSISSLSFHLLNPKPIVTISKLLPPLASLPSRKPPSLSISSSHRHPLSALLLKPACLALTSAALLLSSFHRPSLASPIPTPTTTTTTIQQQDDNTTNEQILEEYLDQCPDDLRSLRALMELKAKSGKYPEAIDVIDRILALDPEDRDLPLLRAHLLTHAGDPHSARIAFEELLDRDPFNVEAYHGLVMASALSDPEDGAVEELARVVERVEGVIERCKKEKRKEELRDLKLLLAQVKVIEGKYEDAIGVYRELVKEEPRDFRPYLCQGIVYSVLKKKDEAEKQFEKYRRLVPRGHPYARYFEDNAVAMKVFGQMEEGKGAGSLRR